MSVATTADVERLPFAWRLVAGLVLLKLALHALAAGPLAWGYMTDELYFLDCADRLQWGYVDHPPLSIAVLAVWRDLFGDSIFAIRIPPAIAGCVSIVATALLARELGGGRTAQGLAGLGWLAIPVCLSMGNYYSMNPLEHALWAVALLLLARLGNDGSPRLWLALGVAVALATLNKVSGLWLAGGIAVGVLLTPLRRALRTPWPWLAAALAAMGALPFALWNAANGWPFLEFTRNAAAEKVGEITLLDFVGQQIMVMGFVPAFIWLPGLVYLMRAEALRHQRALGWAVLFVAALLALSGSARPHYLAPAFPVIIAAGAVMVERLSAFREWIPRTAVRTVALTGLIAMPLAIPVLPPAATVRYQDALGMRPPEEREQGGRLPMHLGLYLHAEAVLAPLQQAFATLPADDQARVEILTLAFGETGAVNQLRRHRGLPHAIGRHNQYGLWGPENTSGELMLVEADDPAQLARWFERCEPRAAIDCPDCMAILQQQKIYLCQHPLRPLRELWPEMRIYR